ncbi:MAG: response regulator [Bacteroidota bacterium]
MKEEKLVFMLLADPDDKLLTYSTLQELGYDVPIQFFSHSTDMFEALIYKKPSIILTDYNLTPESGLDVLRKLKSIENFDSIPVIILIVSPRWIDYDKCYKNGANTVIKKPDTNKITFEKIKVFFDYWMKVAETRSV